MRASVEQLLTLKDHQKLERVQLFGPVLEREDSSSLARQVVEAHKQLSSAPTLKHNIVFYGQTVLNCALATPSAEDFIGSLSLTVPFGIEVVLASFGYHSGDVAKLLDLLRSPRSSRFFPPLEQVLQKIDYVRLINRILISQGQSCSDVSADILAILPQLRDQMSTFSKLGHRRANILWSPSFAYKSSMTFDLLRDNGLLCTNNILVERTADGLSLAHITTRSEVQPLCKALGLQRFTELYTAPPLSQGDLIIADAPLRYLWGGGHGCPDAAAGAGWESKRGNALNHRFLYPASILLNSGLDAQVQRCRPLCRLGLGLSEF
jgi:hypothetical protein